MDEMLVSTDLEAVDGSQAPVDDDAVVADDQQPEDAANSAATDLSAEHIATHITTDAVRRVHARLGRIDVGFPEQPDDAFTYDGIGPFPASYRRTSAKERLLLLFAENFRQQFAARFGRQRRPPVLAPPNECGVQKFVSTSIRPTYVLHTPLIGSWQAMAEFVADFVHFEPLDDQLNMVSATHDARGGVNIMIQGGFIRSLSLRVGLDYLTHVLLHNKS